VAGLVTFGLRWIDDGGSSDLAFANWLDRLKDQRGRARILARLDRLTVGNLGDVKPVGSGMSELRIAHGPGYRVYLVQRAAVLIILLCGGDKTTQSRDIARAKRMAEELNDAP
jgi:putative addiction module killer protein